MGHVAVAETQEACLYFIFFKSLRQAGTQLWISSALLDVSSVRHQSVGEIYVAWSLLLGPEKASWDDGDVGVLGSDEVGPIVQPRLMRAAECCAAGQGTLGEKAG